MKKLTLLVGVLLIAGATFACDGGKKECCKKDAAKKECCKKGGKDCKKSCDKEAAKKMDNKSDKKS